jgi:hypothetical protein
MPLLIKSDSAYAIDIDSLTKHQKREDERWIGVANSNLFKAITAYYYSIYNQVWIIRSLPDGEGVRVGATFCNPIIIPFIIEPGQDLVILLPSNQSKAIVVN